MKRKRLFELDKRCHCRDRNDCLHPWFVRLRVAGKRTRIDLTERYRLTMPMTRTEILVYAAKAKDETRRGPAVAPTRATLGDIADRFVLAFPGKWYYLTALRKSEVTVNGAPVALEDKAMTDITTDDLRQAADARLALAADGVRGGLDARRHFLVVARRLFNWAIQQQIVRTTPFSFEGQPLIAVGKSRRRNRRLQGDEESRLLAAADTFTADRIVAMLELGCRGGELLALKWCDVLDDYVTLTTRKTRDGQPKARKVTISPTLQKLLDRRKKGPDGNDLPSDAHVFGDETGKPISRRLAHRWWNKTRKAAGITDLRFHDLRHEFGSQLLEAGAPLHDVQMALGHENISTTSTYLNSTPEGQRESFQKLASHRLRKRLRIV
jgi:integrase